MNIVSTFCVIADKVAKATGHPVTFVLSSIAIFGWAASGPLFNYSDTWQLVINTATSIVTFLMVFLIQNTQNRESATLQAKLDELIRLSAAQNALIGIEHRLESQVEGFRCISTAAPTNSLSTGDDRRTNYQRKLAPQ